MRVLVTGGAGFIGSAVCRHLVLEAGATVLNVDKLTYAASLASLDPVSASPRFRFRKADIADRRQIAALLEAFEPDAIMHLAAESHVDRSITGATDFIETNIVGTYRLLEAARDYWSRLMPVEKNAFRFLHVSTDEVFGSLGRDGLFREDTRYAPSSPYSASKAASDHLARAWHLTYGLPVIVSSCSNNFGPYQFPEKLIPLMILSALAGRSMPVYGDGTNVRDWLYVDDHARALHLIVTKGKVGETYNVGGRNERTNLAVVERIAELMDLARVAGAPHRRLIDFVADRPGHDHRYGIDASKLEAELGWRALETFETGLAKTVAWYLANEGWWRPLLAHRYNGERLGLIHGSRVA